MKRLLSHRYAFPAIVLLGVVLCAPSLTTGLVADDWFHKLELEHRPLNGMSPHPLDIFTFADGNPDDTHKLMDVGVFPWWTDPEVRLAFFRPLSSLTHAIDYALWPKAVWAMHLQNLLWFALVLVVVGWAFRQFLPLETATLALLLFAIDHVHGPAVGWIANRNALIALACGLPAVVFHQRGRWYAPLVFAIALFAGESAVAALAFIAAYELHLAHGPWTQRLRALLPYVAVMVLWRGLYAGLGYGAIHSGAYFDPGRNPLGYLKALPERASTLLAAQFAIPTSDFEPLYVYIGARFALMMALGIWLVVGLTVIAFVPLWRSNATARFLATGTILSTLPVCAAFPADRLLLFISVGAMGLIALLLTTPQPRWCKPAVFAFIGLHLIVSPLILPERARFVADVEKPLHRAAISVPATQSVVLVNPPSDMLAGYIQPELSGRMQPHPEHIRWLASGASQLEITREDARTLRIKPEGGFFPTLGERMLRDPSRAMPPGTTVQLSGIKIEVLSALPDGRPAEARFRFDVPLEDASISWMQWKDIRYVPFTPPAIGQSITLESVDYLAALFSK